MHKLASALNERVPAASEAGGGGGGGGSSDEEEEAAGPGPQSRLSEVSTGVDTPSLDLQLLSPIGQGSFGIVWRGVLQGHTDVAVKLMQLPDLSSLGPSGAQAAATIRERMVVQEAAIASAVAHPHVVSVFSVGLRPCRPPQQQPAPGAVEQAAPVAPLWQAGGTAAQSTAVSSVRGGAVLWQLTIVMEYCDQGTLRQALDRGRLRSPCTGRTHLPTALALARDVAASLQYLHSQQVVHGDLKASNVLLKTAALPPRGGAPGPGGRHVREGGEGGCGGAGSSEGTLSSGANLIQGGWVVAKICDFGLSSFLDTAGASTALSTQICGGTLTHMAPELLTSAKPTKASDVYAFGILLFEIVTGERPYAGIHNALLGHAVVASRKRPAWPSAMGPEFREAKALAEECWQHHPHARRAPQGEGAACLGRCAPGRAARRGGQ
ncbi:MAG: kinase-like domain-containing protein [Monoraphidium minutum]|nr:MAG: kinase-like domain-containing protein [Monoraphidium minutum]